MGASLGVVALLIGAFLVTGLVLVVLHLLGDSALPWIFDWMLDMTVPTAAVAFLLGFAWLVSGYGLMGWTDWGRGAAFLTSLTTALLGILTPPGGYFGAAVAAVFLLFLLVRWKRPVKTPSPS